MRHGRAGPAVRVAGEPGAYTGVERDRIQVLDTTTGQTHVVGSFDSLGDFVVDAEGNILALDYLEHELRYYDASGVHLQDHKDLGFTQKDCKGGETEGEDP